MKKIVVVYHSGYGHTKVQAEHVHQGAASVSGVQSTLITSDEAIKDMSALNQADAIIFGCPTYMGGVSAQFKGFIDAASKVWAKQGWKNKLAAGFTNSGTPSGDKLATLQTLFINAMQHSMVWVSLGLLNNAKSADDLEATNRLSSFSGAMAQSPQGSAAPLEADLRTAEALGQRVAKAALAWNPAMME